MATLFHGGTLFDGEQYVGAAQVLVADGRIAAVSTGDAAGQPLDAPAGTRVVEHRRHQRFRLCRCGRNLDGYACSGQKLRTLWCQQGA